MADNLDIWILHGAQIGCSVLADGSAFVTGIMDTGNRKIKSLAVAWAQIHSAFIIQNIQFTAQHQLDSVKLSGNYLKIDKVKRMAGAGHLGSVFCNA